MENVLKTFLSVAIVVFVILGASFRRDLQTNTGFKQPFLITYLATCLLSLYMIIFYLYHYITITYKTSFSPSRFFLSFFTSLATGSAAPSVSSVETTSVESPTSNSASTSPSPNSDSGVVLSLPLLLHPSPSSPQSHLSSSSSSAFSSVAPPPSPSFLLHEEFLDKAQLVSGQPLSHLLLLAFPFTLLWLITNYFFTLSLSLTSVASAVRYCILSVCLTHTFIHFYVHNCSLNDMCSTDNRSLYTHSFTHIHDNS